MPPVTEEEAVVFDEAVLRTQMHFDMSDNLYSLVSGAKRFSIISPAAACHLPTVTPISYVSPSGYIATMVTDGLADRQHRNHFLRMADVLNFNAR